MSYCRLIKSKPCPRAVIRTSIDICLSSSLTIGCHSWYLATDETDPDALELFRKAGALTLHDLMNDDDREYLGWQANFGDILALVDQQVLARSSFFVGSSMSSTTGGVLNQRQHLDKPAWSSTFVQ